MKYNIDFELAAIIFVAMMRVHVKSQYNMDIRANKVFYRMVNVVLLADILDVVTAVTISYANIVPWTVNIVLNTVYFMATVALAYLFYEYAFASMYGDNVNQWVHMVAWVTMISYILALIVNVPFGYIFEFRDGQYIHGPLYLLVYFVPYVFFFVGTIIFLAYSRKLSDNQRRSMYLYLAVSFSGVILQIVFFPNVLLNLFTISIAIIVILFALETPEHKEMIRAYEDLNGLNEGINNVLNNKKYFLTNINRNFYAPFSKIRFHVNEIYKNADNADSVRANCEAMRDEFSDLTSRFEQILNYNDMFNGEISIVNENYHISDMINECVSCFREELTEKGLSMDVRISKDLPNALVGDVRHISLVLHNLILNAINHSSNGQIVLRVMSNTRDTEEIKLIISVEDAGSGIEEDQLAGIFSPLETNENSKGIGLGLSVSKVLVESLNGSIDVYSTKDKGTLVYFEVPQKIGH